MPALLYVPFHQVVHAYVDWGSASIIVQVVVGSLVAVLVAMKLYWKQTKAFVRNLFSRSKKSEQSKEH
ncbi:MAG: hypothetical protein JW753_07810 [Dehalococcoidia bacterium]|nr:hypothetical protein [Dehalococcoidia bacterium]